MTDYSKYPICDCDIWVYLNHSDLITPVLNYYEKLLIPDMVRLEILSWKRNHTDKFKHIATSLEKYIEDGLIIILYHNEIFTQDELKIVNKTLRLLGMSEGVGVRERNKGEYVGAIYSDHLQVPFFTTNDSTFQPGGRGKKAFSDLKIKNWQNLLNEFVSDRKQRDELILTIKEISSQMQKDFEEVREKREMLTLIEQEQRRKVI